MKILGDNSILLCCGKANCPVIKRDGENITITDDYGSSVKMSLDQAGELIPAVRLLNNEREQETIAGIRDFDKEREALRMKHGA